MTYPCCGKSTGHASWCTTTPRMLAGETVTYTNARTVVKHETRLEWEDAVVGQDDQGVIIRTRYRWHCSCGANPGRWVTRRSQAEQGAKTHARRAR